MPPTEPISKRNTIATITDGAAKKVSISTLADRPNTVSRYGDGGLSAGELKARFDALPELNRKKINEIIDALASNEAASYITLGDFLGVDNLSDFLDRFTSSEISSYILAEYAKETDRHEQEYDLNTIIADLNSRLVSESLTLNSALDELDEFATAVSGYNDRISAAEKTVREIGDNVGTFDDRITGIEVYLGGDNFVVDNTVRGDKSVPNNACEKAKLLSISGMTHKVRGEEDPTYFPYPYTILDGVAEKNGVLTVTRHIPTDDGENWIRIGCSRKQLRSGYFILDLGNAELFDAAPCLLTDTGGLDLDSVDFEDLGDGMWRFKSKSSTMKFYGIGICLVRDLRGQEIRPVLYKEGTPEEWQDKTYNLAHSPVKKIRSWSASGNLITYPYYDGDNKTVNGITFTVNKDKSITVNGTATANAIFYIYKNPNRLPAKLNRGGKYGFSISSIPSAGSAVSNNGVQLFTEHVKETGSVENKQLNSGTYNTSFLTYPSTSDYKGFNVYLKVSSGKKISNITYYPMVSITDIDPDFEAPCQQLDEVEIPDDIVTRADYGIGASACQNRIIFNDNGLVFYEENMYKYVFSDANVGCSEDFVDGWGTYRWRLSGHPSLAVRKTGISAADTANYSNCDRLNAVDSDTDKVGYYFDPASTDIIINSPYSGLAEFKNWLEGTVFELPYATPYVEDITSKMSKKFLTVVKGGGLSLETSFDIVHEGYDIPNSIKYLVYYPKGETL